MQISLYSLFMQCLQYQLLFFISTIHNYFPQSPVHSLPLYSPYTIIDTLCPSIKHQLSMIPVFKNTSFAPKLSQLSSYTIITPTKTIEKSTFLIFLPCLTLVLSYMYCHSPYMYFHPNFSLKILYTFSNRFLNTWTYLCFIYHVNPLTLPYIVSHPTISLPFRAVLMLANQRPYLLLPCRNYILSHDLSFTFNNFKIFLLCKSNFNPSLYPTNLSKHPNWVVHFN